MKILQNMKIRQSNATNQKSLTKKIRPLLAAHNPQHKFHLPPSFFTSFLGQLVCWTLIFQISLALPLLPLAQANGGGNNSSPPQQSGGAPDGTSNEIADAIATASVTDRPLKASDETFHVTGQLRRKYTVDSQGVEQIEWEKSLDRNDITVEPVAITDRSKEIKLRYNADKKELEICHYSRDMRSGRYLITDSHVVTNLELTGDINNINERLNSDEQNDPNFVLLNTKAGVRALVWEQALPADAAFHEAPLFVAPVILPVIIPAPQSGAAIERVSYLHPGRNPRPLYTSEAGEATATNYRTTTSDGAIATSFRDGDIATEIRTSGAYAESLKSVVVSRSEEFIPVVRLRQKQLLAAISAVNAPLENVGDIELALRQGAQADALAAQRIDSARDAILFGKQDDGQNHANQNDLVVSAITNLAQRSNVLTLMNSLTPDHQGNDAYQNLARATRPSRSTASTGAEASQWAQLYQQIQDSQNRARAENRPVPSWRDALVESMNQSLRDPNSALAQAEKAKKSEGNSFLSRTRETFQRLVTPRRLKIFAGMLATSGALYLANSATDGALVHWTTVTASRLLDWSTQVPVLKILTTPIKNSVGYFTNTWAWLRWGAGLAIILSIYPLSLLPTKMIAKMQGLNWTSAQAFFTYFSRMAAWANYGIRTVVWRNVLGQRALYEAMDNKISISQNWRDVLNLPHRDAVVSALLKLPIVGSWLASRGLRADTTQHQMEALQDVVHSQTVRKQRAKLLAAAVVSENSKIDMATLLMAEVGQQYEQEQTLVRNMNAEQLAKWSELSVAIHKELLTLHDKGVGNLNHSLTPEDARQMETYTKVYKDIAQRYNEERQRGPDDVVAKNLKVLWNQSRQTMSKHILPWVFFGKVGYDFYRKYRNFSIDAESSSIAIGQYGPDYISSVFYYGAMDAAKFGDVPTLRGGATEVLVNQIGQPVIYGSTSGIDVATSHAGTTGLQNPYQPLTVDFFNQGLNGESDGPQHQEQTASQGIGIIASQVANPEAGSLFDTWKNYMRNSMVNFEGRWLLGSPVRIAGMLSAAYVASMTGPHAGQPLSILRIVQEGALKEAFWWTAKYGFTPIVLGYAFIWPIVTRWTLYLQDAAKNNHMRITTASTKLAMGVEEGNDTLMREGVSELQSLYQEGQKTLPADLAVTPDQYDALKARNLLKHVAKHMPLATKRSSMVVTTMLNVVMGSVISTVFFMGMSGMAFGNTSGPELLAKGLTSLGITYAMMSPAKKAAQTLARGYQGVASRVRRLFNKDKACEVALKNKTDDDSRQN